MMYPQLHFTGQIWRPPYEAELLSSSEHRVNRWVKRYRENGIDGLRNKPGQGAKPIMDASDEQAAVREAIANDRLSVMKAKERWQQATGKKAWAED